MAIWSRVSPRAPRTRRKGESPMKGQPSSDRAIRARLDRDRLDRYLQTLPPTVVRRRGTEVSIVRARPVLAALPGQAPPGVPTRTPGPARLGGRAITVWVVAASEARAALIAAGWLAPTRLGWTHVRAPARHGKGPTLPVARFGRHTAEPADTRRYTERPYRGNPRQGKQQ